MCPVHRFAPVPCVMCGGEELARADRERRTKRGQKPKRRPHLDEALDDAAEDSHADL